MANSKYPIHHAPSAEYTARLAQEQDPQWTVTGLEFIQHSPISFSAKWNQGAVGKTFNMEMNVGGKERTLEEIQERVINALKPDGTI